MCVFSLFLPMLQNDNQPLFYYLVPAIEWSLDAPELFFQFKIITIIIFSLKKHVLNKHCGPNLAPYTPAPYRL